jgi:ligand-binding sensor domain-containing protein
MQSVNGGYNDVTKDYWHYRRQALKWARYALQNRADGLPWQGCAKMAHEMFGHALTLGRL